MKMWECSALSEHGHEHFHVYAVDSDEATDEATDYANEQGYILNDVVLGTTYRNVYDK